MNIKGNQTSHYVLPPPTGPKKLSQGTLYPTLATLAEPRSLLLHSQRLGNGNDLNVFLAVNG